MVSSSPKRPSEQRNERLTWQRLGLPPCILVVLMLTTFPAVAHSGSVSEGILGGFAHPIFGADHVVAMVAVGLWGAFLGPPAIFILPVLFPLVMAFGGVLGLIGVPLVGTELGIASSAVLLGMMVAFAARPPLWVATVIVGAFAIFHGHAHGAEFPAGADANAYFIGFVIATGLLHLIGIAFGFTMRWPVGRIGVRGAGAAIASVGMLFLWQLA
jgi:urease accessory protein